MKVTAKKTKKDDSFMSLLDQYSKEASTPGAVARAFRINSELTLAEVAKITKIPNTNLSKLETDKSPMTSQYAERLAAVYGVHPAVILYPEGYSYESEKYKQIAESAKKLRKLKSAI